MANYEVKYRIEYLRKSGGQTTIDILERDYVGAITDLKACSDPLQIPLSGDSSNIYKPTIGSGCTINVMVTPLTMDDLYTNDPQKFIVKIYDGASEDSSGAPNLVWQGFINAEIFSESYSTPLSLKGRFSISCNDGMVLLDKIKYKTAADAYYLGTVNVSSIFNNILEKLSIDFTNIYTSNDLTIKPAPSPATNPFLYLQLANENFVDENGVPMSCRQVLDSIVSGLGMVLFFKSNDIYIIDPINLHTVSKGKSYLRSDFTEVGQVDIGGYLDISAGDINWYETGSQRDIFPQVDQVILKYDPFTFDKYEYDFSKRENWSEVGSFNDVGTYWLNETIEFLGWTNEYDESAYTPHTIGTQEDLANVITGSPDYALNLYNNGSKLRYNLPDFHSVTQDQNLAIRVSFDVWVQTNSNDLNIWAGNAAAHIINAIKIPVRVSVGNQHWRGGTSWTTVDDPEAYQPLLVIEEGVLPVYPNYANSVINDKWVKGTMLVPLCQNIETVLLSGNISIEIYDSLRDLFFVNQVLPPEVNTPFVYHVLLKNMLIEMVDVNTGKVVVNEGVNFRAFVSTNLTGKEEFTIDTTCGTGTYGSSKAAFKSDQITPAGTNITGLYRGDETTVFDTAKLILQSFISQYKRPRFVLNGKLNVVDQLLDIKLKLIQDTNHLPGKSFYIVSGVYQDREECMAVEMLELTTVRETLAEIEERLAYLEDGTTLTNETYIYAN